MEGSVVRFGVSRISQPPTHTTSISCPLSLESISRCFWAIPLLKHQMDQDLKEFMYSLLRVPRCSHSNTSSKSCTEKKGVCLISNRCFLYHPSRIQPS